MSWSKSVSSIPYDISLVKYGMHSSALLGSSCFDWLSGDCSFNLQNVCYHTAPVCS